MLVPRLVNSSKLLRLIKYLVIVLFLLLLVPYLNTPEVHDAYVDVLRSFQDAKRLFLQDFMAHDIEARVPNHGLQLAKLCANKTWFPEDKAVVLTCDPLSGGLGGVKNGHLNCIRFAIEVGAQLVLPRMHLRSETDITNLHGAHNSKGIELDYMFSTDHLVDSLAASCPQLKVHASLDALYDKPSLLQPLSLGSLAQLNTNDEWAVLNATETTILQDPSTLRPVLLAAMEARLPAPPKKRHWPLRVNLGNSLFVWPTLERGQALRREIGSLLRTRDDIRLLAGSALYSLARKFDLPQLLRLDTGFTGAGTLTNFTGVHLRTEKDAQLFPEYDVQAQYFLSHLKNRSSSSDNNNSLQRNHIVYLATGLRASDKDVQDFRARAAEHGATVVLKRDLLDDTELAVLDHLSWDQAALVDYEIMLRAGHVLGVVESSFAWAIALKRAALYDGGGGPEALTAQPQDPESSDGGELVMWRDPLSTLFGKADAAVSLYYGTWP